MAKIILQKDIIYYFKYREFSAMFTINEHISDNSQWSVERFFGHTVTCTASGLREAVTHALAPLGTFHFFGARIWAPMGV